MVRNQGRVTRFVVMAVLQAARAQQLGLPHDSALSWGLNRAIFYAAAKQGFRQAPTKTGEERERPPAAPATEAYRLGHDEAFRDPDSKELRFTIGGQVQTVERFDQQVAARFGTNENFRTAWDEATRIVGGFDRSVLESPQRFYGEVYKPLRDELSDSWTQKYSPAPVKPAAGARRPPRRATSLPR
ncbi:MAG TPA: hypothetical protein VMG99_05120 [Thermoplasmata archaeon]|nr:hypothetical protein [Thermoplasmata archaeon]